MGGGFIIPGCERRGGQITKFRVITGFKGGLSRGGGGTGNEVFIITTFRSEVQMANLVNMWRWCDAAATVQRVCGSAGPSGRGFE